MNFALTVFPAPLSPLERKLYKIIVKTWLLYGSTSPIKTEETKPLEISKHENEKFSDTHHWWTYRESCGCRRVSHPLISISTPFETVLPWQQYFHVLPWGEEGGRCSRNLYLYHNLITHCPTALAYQLTSLKLCLHPPDKNMKLSLLHTHIFIPSYISTCLYLFYPTSCFFQFWDF